MIKFYAIALITLLTGCGTEEVSPKSTTSTIDSTLAESAAISVSEIVDGSSIFIKKLRLSGYDNNAIKSIDFTITSKPDALATPLHVSYSHEKIKSDFTINAAEKTLLLPVFGLYSNYANQVQLTYTFVDDSKVSVLQIINTEEFIEPDEGVYTQMLVNTLPSADNRPSFSYFFIKNKNYSPIILDIDGNIRWLAPKASVDDAAAYFDGKQFIIGDTRGSEIYLQSFDGSSKRIDLSGGKFSKAFFHHNIDAGKVGFLAELDVTVDGIEKKEAYLAEILSDGSVIKEWDMGEIFTAYMNSQGDDASKFVRYTSPVPNDQGSYDAIDWFHMNTATYDPSDDTIIISSRENFIVKLDYETGKILWLLGDESKYWYQNFPSLRDLAPVLSLGKPPIGVHGLSIANDGSLLLFNNGFHSNHQPTGEAAGVNRDFSTASKYQVSDDDQSYQEVWSFDENILSDICSSIYQHSGGDYLLNYAAANGRSLARVVILTEQKEILFDVQFPTQGCSTSWNAQIIELDNLVFN